jgi:glycopeptide antibiotics resistance protein
MEIVVMLSDKGCNNQPSDFNRRHFSLNKILDKLTKEEKAFVLNLIDRDPLKGLYQNSFVAYLLVLILFLLWPFDLVPVSKKNNVRWLGTSNGIEFPQEGQVLSLSSTESLTGNLLIGTGFTLEVWVATDNPDQTGPARIVSYSLDPSKRNFTLGQSKKKLIMRLRTTETSLNGTHPHMEVDGVFESSDPKHIVVTYNFSKQSVYVNGDLRKRAEIPGGRFANWNSSHSLVLGNEATGDRPWIGKIFYVAIYNRPLTDHEIHQNYMVGWASEAISSGRGSLASGGIVAHYLFEERKGDKISNGINSSTLIDLHIPKTIISYKKAYLSFDSESYKRAYLSFDLKEFLKNPRFGDVALNILIFLPIGFLFHAGLRIRYGSSLKTFVLVLFVGTLFIFGIESLQYFSVTRNSSFKDVINNILGVTIGICADRLYEVYLKRQVKFLLIKTRRP